MGACPKRACALDNPPFPPPPQVLKHTPPIASTSAGKAYQQVSAEMRASRRRVNTYLLSAISAALVIGSEGFLGSVHRLSTAVTTPTGRRCRVPRLALTPPGKPGSGVGAGSAAAGGEENGKTASNNRITRAPLRITPNFQPQEKRRPKTDVRRDMAYGAFLTEKSFDIAGEFVKQ